VEKASNGNGQRDFGAFGKLDWPLTVAGPRGPESGPRWPGLTSSWRPWPAHTPPRYGSRARSRGPGATPKPVPWLLVTACKGSDPEDTDVVAVDTDDGPDTDVVVVDTDDTDTPVDTDDTDVPVDTDVGAACLPDGALAILQAHLLHVDSAVGLLAGHPSDREAISFVDVPGFEGPLSYYTLIGACTEEMSYDEYCDPSTKLCSTISCTGVGAGWQVHLRNSRTIVDGDFTFTTLTSDTSWADGSDGFDWTAASAASANGVDWSTTAVGSVVPSGSSYAWSLTETLPAMSDAGEAVLTVSHAPSGGSGTLVIGATTVATIDDTLTITTTGDCP
jgi:hypothetical protein